jgi:hypothetical protein
VALLLAPPYGIHEKDQSAGPPEIEVTDEEEVPFLQAFDFTSLANKLTLERN